MTDRIGELLLREKLISQEQLKTAINEKKKSGGRLGYNLTKLWYISEKALTSFLSRQYGIPTIDLSTQDIDSEVIKLIPEDVAQKYQVIPVSRSGETAEMAGLEGVLTEFDDDEMEIVQDEDEVDLSDLKRAVEDAPVVKLVNLILTDAIKTGGRRI